MGGPISTIARERNHTMMVGSGVFLLRYVSSSVPENFPTIRVKASAKESAGISLLPVPGHPSGGLVSPGECMVIRAERPGALDLTVCASKPNGSLEAEVRLERIAASEPAAPHQAPAKATAQAASAPSAASSAGGLEVLAHVARRGDVMFPQGAWICGPDAPMTIEGLEIRWPGKPAGVGLRYGVIIGRRNRPVLEEKDVGEFAGTRGEAAPLLGVTLALTGACAREHELCADALFLGSAPVSKSGSEIAFYGPTGREPLVGLRLSILNKRIDPEVVRPPAKPRAVAVKQVGRVRVYRPGSGPAPKSRRAVRA
jgi:hypothetical protein